MSNIIDRLKALEMPEVLSRQRAWELFAQGTLGHLGDLAPFTGGLMAILESQDFKSLVSEGKITLAMIKPRLDDSIDPNAIGDVPLNDLSLAQFFLSRVRPPLEPTIHASLVMTNSMVDKFYDDGPKQKMQRLPAEFPIRHPQAQNRWDEWVENMTGGPATFAPLFSSDGQAVDHWRTQMGDDWNVDRLKQNHPNSLRAMAKDTDRNLLHGSDSPESVRREINLLISFLESLNK